MKKIVLSVLIFYFHLSLFGFHQQVDIYPEGQSVPAPSSGSQIRRTVRDSQGGLLEEGLIQLAHLESNINLKTSFIPTFLIRFTVTSKFCTTTIIMVHERNPIP